MTHARAHVHRKAIPGQKRGLLQPFCCSLDLSEGRRRPLLDSTGNTASSKWAFFFSFLRGKHLFSCISSCRIFINVKVHPLEANHQFDFHCRLLHHPFLGLKTSEQLICLHLELRQLLKNLTLVPINISGHMTDHLEAAGSDRISHMTSGLLHSEKKSVKNVLG